MKKIKLLLLAVIIAAPTFSAFADDEDKTKGIRAGWQTSNFYDENENWNVQNQNQNQSKKMINAKAKKPQKNNNHAKTRKQNLVVERKQGNVDFEKIKCQELIKRLNSDLI